MKFSEDQIEKFRKELKDLYANFSHSKAVAELRWHRKYLDEAVEQVCPDCVRSMKMSTKRFWFMNGVREFPKCAVCGRPITRDVINAKRGYTLRPDKENLFCRDCMKKSAGYVEKQRSRIAERFGKINGKAEYPPYVGESERLKYTRRLKVFKRLLENEYVRPVFSIEEFFMQPDRTKKMFLKWECLKCGKVFRSPCCRSVSILKRETGADIPARCPACFPPLNRSSAEERDFAKELERRHPDCRIIHNKFENWKVIPPYQLDVLVEKDDEIILAVEFDGTRWHSLEEGKPIDAQLRKTVACEKIGVPLVHVYEDEYFNFGRMREIWLLIDRLTRHPKQLEADSPGDVLILDRDKVSKAVNVMGFELIGETPAETQKERTECPTRSIPFPTAES